MRTTETETEHLIFTLHVVRSRKVERNDDGFDADETPSLPGMSVYDTTCDPVTETRGPELAKCGPVAAERKRAGGRK